VHNCPITSSKDVRISNLNQPSWQRGFTLIELVIVVTIVAILAAVTVPAFQNMQKRAKNAAAKAALGAFRTAVQAYRMSEIVSGRQSGFGMAPSNGCPGFHIYAVDQPGALSPYAMEGGLNPDNPWSHGVVTEGRESWVIITSAAKGTLVAPVGGWVFDANTCEFWANTAVNGGPITENEF